MVNTTPTEDRLRRMKRRLRKKRHLGEFQEHAFELRARFTDALDENALESLTVAFLAEVDARGLAYIGAVDPKWLDGTLVSRRSYHSPSDEDRQALEGWLKSRQEVAATEAGALFDAHYGWS